MEDRLARYLSPRLANGDVVTIERLGRIPGGASRQTWMFDARWDGGCLPLVLRLDPPASLIDTDREQEWAFYQAFAPASVPVPTMHWLEPDESHLGGSFFLMERILEIEAQPRNLMMPAWADARQRIASEMYEIMAATHGFEWRGAPIDGAVPMPPVESACKHELDSWERVVDENELSPQPIIRAAIRWLRKNPPPSPERITVVHGDFRAGNLLCLHDASALIADEHLAMRARACGARRIPEDFRLSTVQAHDAVRAMLIEVHAASEETPGPDPAINRRIWAELQASTVRRQTRSTT